MTTRRSLTRHLIATVLLVELVAAAILVGAGVLHERHIRMVALDVMLRGRADTLLGAVQDSEDEADDVMLDKAGLSIPGDDFFRVVDEKGRVLGDFGPDTSEVAAALSSADGISTMKIAGHRYRVIRFRGVRVVDPGRTDGGVAHTISGIYGLRMGYVWHEVFEAVRFSVIATLGLLGVTALIMVWLVRRSLAPLHELASEAERVSLGEGSFEAPESASDTAELKPLAAAIESALARLQRSLEQQRRLTSDAAHELKTDLAIAKSSMQLLAMRTRTVAEYQQGLGQCLDDYARLEKTVQQMLTLARVEHNDGMDRSMSASCDLRACVEATIQQSRQLAELRQIEVHLGQAEKATVPVEERDGLLLCSNLLLNALQHSLPETTVEIGIGYADGAVILTVRDRGEGFAEEDLPHVFEPFYRGDPSRNRKSGGTGLGLAICKAICERAGGGIRIVNHPGGGAEVTVRLPRTASLPTQDSGHLKPAVRD
jgi:signal transduction histidine kinase